MRMFAKHMQHFVRAGLMISELLMLKKVEKLLRNLGMPEYK